MISHSRGFRRVEIPIVLAFGFGRCLLRKLWRDISSCFEQ